MHQSQKALILNNGMKIYSIQQLNKSINKINDKTFSAHINEDKNDFYDWAKNTLKDAKLAEDLLECTTKEAVKFCIAGKLDANQNKKVMEGLPAGYDRENDIFKELPRGYPQKIGIDSQRTAKLPQGTFDAYATLINAEKSNNLNSKSKARMSMNFEKKSIIKTATISQIIEQIKEVYSVE